MSRSFSPGESRHAHFNFSANRVEVVLPQWFV
jgi:hypothetical protein